MAPITILQDVLKSTLATMDELKDSLPDIHPCKLSVVLCDKNGLCYGAEPPEESEWAGSYRSIVDKAAQLAPDEDPPVVLIETSRRNIIVRDIDSLVISVSAEADNY